MKKVIIAFLLVGVMGASKKLLAQTNRSEPLSFFVELGGSGGLGSINIERPLYRFNPTQLNWRAGLSIAPIDRNNGTAIVFPLMINALIGKSAHRLDLGIGQGLTVTTKGRLFALTTPAVGYRYQSDAGPWFYRIAYTPLVSYIVDFQIQHWAGVSVGYTFNRQKP